ncbi:MAG: HIRAN domain-containing protein [Ignavibacteria bacterium]|nr:HIRAN domain-containing protein [Ignavibacteria bacterium]
MTFQDVPIAGIQFGKFCRIDRFAQLHVGQELELVGERENKYDNRAIAIRTREGKMIGYVSMLSNEILANLMDQGLTLSCTITLIEYADNPWDPATVSLDLVSSSF